MSSDPSMIFMSMCFGFLCLVLGYFLIKSGRKAIKEIVPEKTEDGYKNYYFTYGTDKGFPFILGWTRVVAPSYESAVAAFKSFHPCRNDYGTINCSSIYTEEQFFASSLPLEGNGGVFEQEFIKISRYAKEVTMPTDRDTI